MDMPNLTTAYRAARKTGHDCFARPLPAAVALERARANLARYRDAAAHAEDAAALRDAAKAAAESWRAAGQTPPEPTAEIHANALRERSEELARARRVAARLRRLVAYYGPSDYGAGTWQGGRAPRSPEEQTAARERDADRRAAAPFQGVPPAMRGARYARFPCPRFMDVNRRPGDGGRDGGHFAAHDDTAAGAFRYIRDAEDVAGVRVGAWITDPCGDIFRDGTGLCVPVVARLPNRNGRARFAPGYRFGGCDDSGVFDLSRGAICESDALKGDDSEAIAEEAERDAARAADAMAERAADEEREFQSAFQAGAQWRDKAEELDSIRAELAAVLAERRAARATAADWPALCDTIRRRVSGLLDRRAELREEREELARGDSLPWSFWPGEERLRDAFREGAGLDTFPGHA